MISGKPGNVEATTASWRAINVAVRMADGEEIRTRLAVFLFDSPGGFTWVEPSYADPWGAPSPAWHQRTGAMEWNGSEWVCTGGDGERVALTEWIAEDGTEAELRTVAAFETWLMDAGVTKDEARELVRADLALGTAAVGPGIGPG